MNLNSLEHQKMLEQISKHCPQAMWTFMHLYNRRDEEGCVYMSRKQIETHLSENYAGFKKNVMALARENLLMWAEIDDGISIMMDRDD